jgi:predicted TIM-barrel fold metal-dependent hydrolase
MTLGLTPKQVVEEFDTIPIRESVRPKWMGENAARLLNL